MGSAQPATSPGIDQYSNRRRLWENCRQQLESLGQQILGLAQQPVTFCHGFVRLGRPVLPENRDELRELIREELARFLVRTDGTPHRELGIEPLFTVDVACAAVPCSERSLYTWLTRGGFEALYRWVGNRRYRMLPASQVRWVREQMVRKRRRILAAREA